MRPYSSDIDGIGSNKDFYSHKLREIFFYYYRDHHEWGIHEILWQQYTCFWRLGIFDSHRAFVGVVPKRAKEHWYNKLLAKKLLKMMGFWKTTTKSSQKWD